MKKDFINIIEKNEVLDEVSMDKLKGGNAIASSKCCSTNTACHVNTASSTKPPTTLPPTTTIPSFPGLSYRS